MANENFNEDPIHLSKVGEEYVDMHPQTSYKDVRKKMISQQPEPAETKKVSDMTLDNAETQLTVTQNTPKASLMHRMVVNTKNNSAKILFLLGKPFDRVKNYFLGYDKHGDKEFFSLTRTVMQGTVLAAFGIFKILQLDGFLIAAWEFVKQALKALWDVLWIQLSNLTPSITDTISTTYSNISENLGPLFSSAPDWLKQSPQWLRSVLLGEYAAYFWILLGILIIGKIISWFINEYKASKLPGLQSTK